MKEGETHLEELVPVVWKVTMLKLAGLREALGLRLILPEEILCIDRELVPCSQMQAQYELANGTRLSCLKYHDYVVVPGPAREIAFSEIRALRPAMFFLSEEQWYWRVDELLAQREVIGPGWIVMRFSTAQNTEIKCLGEQCALLRPDECRPTLAELAWTLVLLAETRKAKMCASWMAATRSSIKPGQYLAVGHFDQRGMEVNTLSEESCLARLGLAASLGSPTRA